MNRKVVHMLPITKIFFGHYFGSALVGLTLLSLESLRFAHFWLKSFVDWIPNVPDMVRLTPDPIFAETFLGASFFIALAILVYLMIFCRKKYYSMTYSSRTEKFFRGALFALFSVLLIFVMWIRPYADADHVGRTSAIIGGAISTRIGIILVMNFLVVGIPLLFALFIWAQVFTTDVYRR
jgi:hypothetical protein